MTLGRGFFVLLFGWAGRPLRLLGAVVGVLALCSCNLYRLTVQQGNVITQAMVDSLQPGMTREQVAYVMGEPVVRNLFDENRWDYVYTLDLPGKIQQQRRVSLFFADDVLERLRGDLKPSATSDEDDAGPADTVADAD